MQRLQNLQLPGHTGVDTDIVVVKMFIIFLTTEILHSLQVVVIVNNS